VESGLVEVKAGLMSQLNEDSHIVIGPTCMGGSSILQKKQGNSQRKKRRCSRSSKKNKRNQKMLNATTALTTAIVAAMSAVSPTAAVAATAVAATTYSAYAASTHFAATKIHSTADTTTHYVSTYPANISPAAATIRDSAAPSAPPDTVVAQCCENFPHLCPYC
jgi:hypothetical protein